jgi:hypothetical protein
MRILTRIFFFLCLSVPVFAQKIVNDPHVMTRSVSPFTGVKVSSGIELMLTSGTNQAVAISIDKPEYSDRVVTEVIDGVLRIYFKEDVDLTKQKNSWKRTIKAYVAIPVLEKLMASSGARVTTAEAMQTGTLSIDLSSGATCKGNFSGTTLKVEQSSGAVSQLEGQFETVTADLSSGAKCNAYALSAKSARLTVNSGAKIEMQVDRELNGEAHSGGQIYYKGLGAVTAARTHSGGKVNHIQ